MKQLNVQLLLTGNELMAGDIIDSNSAMIAQELKEIGLEVTRKVTVADNLAALCDEIADIAAKADILLINGGLGPTVDDMTAQALSMATGAPIVQHSEALAHLKNWCKKRGTQLNAPNLKQTMLPEGCRIIANKNGSAVGFALNHHACDIYCTPGVPHELKTMLLEQIKPELTKKVPVNNKTTVTRMHVFGIGESSLQKLIDNNLPNWPKNIELGFRAGNPLLEIKLTTRTSEAFNNMPCWLDEIRQLIGDHLTGELEGQSQTLAANVLSLLREQQLQITTAESCTGGLIASRLTAISGSSESFEAGYVTYSNRIKNQLLDVSEVTLSSYGAVSKETVSSMAMGALKKSSANLVIAVSGIAGPNGGTANKPVGTVWIAWGNKENLHTQCLLIPGNRKDFQSYVANIGLDLIRRFLMSSNEKPNYINERQFNVN